MIVESHITYNQELQLNDEVDINLTYFDHDKKRLQYKMEMIHKEKKYLASTIEILALYVDLNQRKVAEFEDEKIKLMDNFINENKSKFNDENLKFSSKNKKMKIKLELFGASRDFSTKDFLELEVPDKASINDLRNEIVQYLNKNFKGNQSFIKIVKSSAFCSENNEIITDNYKIIKDQKIGIIPPIGGG